MCIYTYIFNKLKNSVSSVNLNVPPSEAMDMECVQTIFYGKGLVKDRFMRGLLSQLS